MTSSDKVSNQWGDVEVDLSVVEATESVPGIDISQFMASTGVSSYDQGFVKTSSAKSAITFIDGETRVLHHRGYPIAELAAKKYLFEVNYLLINGELPTDQDAGAFDSAIRRHTLLHEDLKTSSGLFPSLPIPWL